jgi:hypothetical protein
VGRILLNGAFISWLYAAASRIGEKKGNKYPSKNNPYLQTEDVLCNPENPVNPDSELGERW